jgi:hypothetical protein
VRKSNKNHWGIRPINNDGTLGAEIDNGKLPSFHKSMLSFQVKEQTYIFGLEDINNSWFIRPIDDNGKLGEPRDLGCLEYFYPSMFLFQNKEKTYIFGQTKTNNSWFIREIYDNDIIEEKPIAEGKWDNFYEKLLPIELDNIK